MPKRGTLTQRFWEKVRMSDGCWEWTGTKNNRGYGMLWHMDYGRQKLAHRICWELHFGRPPDNLVVCHRCDNPKCVNPSHLFLATHKDNTQDAVCKGRLAVGERVGGSKLRKEDVQEILRRLAVGEERADIACLFGVHVSSVDQILSGRTWKHVPRTSTG